MPVKPELLAPAGAWESLVAAVENGADAVYLGGKSYNARESAGNFDDDELIKAVEFAHVRGVKVYVAVNTLLADHELTGAAQFLHFLQRAGADAVIVQDAGLIRLARRVIPELPLHASTQMTVHNLPAARLLKEKGISRIVLARELSLENIKEITGWGGVEVESFVHGALCICYSGQCLLSSLIGGRSGNRGRCAQPCRLSYVLVDEKNRPVAEPDAAGEHLLSPRDLNMSRHLPDLLNAGITSLKIEGRMKRPEYVATVVRIYRKLLDRAAEGAGYEVTPEEAGELAQIFNRDFTTGYFYGRPGRDLMSYKRPNNRGVRLGRIKGFDRKQKMAELSLEKPLRLGDGVEVWVTEGGRAAGEVRRIVKDGKSVERAAAGDIVYLDIPGRVFPGDRVFKTHDADLIERARATFASPKEQKKIPLIFEVFARLNEPLLIRVTDQGGLTGVAETKSPCQRALKRPLTRAYLANQLGRLGNTPFAMTDLRCELAEPVIVPVAEINEARRRALAVLEKRRMTAARQEPVSDQDFRRRLSAAFFHEKMAKPATVGLPELAVAVTDLASLAAAVEAGAGIVYFGGEQYRSKEPVTPEVIQPAGELCGKAGVRFILSSPRILQDKELAWFCRLLEKVDATLLDGVQAGNLGLITKVGKITGKPVYADFSLNVFNREAAIFLMETGVARVTLSPELTMEQIRRLAPALPVPAEVIVHGALPLMVSEHCVAGSLLGCGNNCAGPCAGRHWGLRDRKGIVFPFEMDQFCRMQLFNSRDLCIIEDIGLLAGTGVTVLRIEARREGAEYVRDVVRAYRLAMSKLPEALEDGVESRAKEALVKYSPGGFTRGHYYRGVL
ncbi:MAG: putative protease YhbU precursor [Pelotomaculum sp. PtaU1.Bin065]|nr:MAG: putative protease YhbU precursor [Pelotomaculum sp. PtaU1.Bin065]